MHELVAEVWRSDFLESVHHGSVVALDATAAPALSVGQPELPMFPRSSNKPLQAVGMVRQGLGLDGELLALACASHSGEAFHIDGVRRMLAGAGRSERDLRCTDGLPIGEQALRRQPRSVLERAAADIAFKRGNDSIMQRAGAAQLGFPGHAIFQSNAQHFLYPNRVTA